MTPKVAKVVVRIVGTVAAVLGLLGFYRAAFMNPLPIPSIDFGSWWIAFRIVGLIIDAWLVWIGYLVWFRFSPLAVQQACGFLGVVAIVLFSLLRAFSPELMSAGWFSLAFLGWILFVLVFYRLLSRYFNRIIFFTPQSPMPYMPPLPKRR